jgi:bacillithiol disulfide reductase
MTHELLIVGAGPAGLAAAYTAKQCGLDYVVLERARIAQTIDDYPVGKPLHSPPQDIELAWGELYSRHRPNPTREELIAHYLEFARRQQLVIRTGECVHGIEAFSNGFTVLTDKGQYSTRKIIVATGGFGVPRRLGVPGENPQRVSYRFADARPYVGAEVLVVGGGNSAAEAALWLHEAGARVTLSLRRASFAPRDGVNDAFTSVKPFNIRPLEALAARGALRIVFNSRVSEVTPDAALLQIRDCLFHTVRCSHVFALVGADPDVRLLGRAGAAIAADGRPVYDPVTYETTLPGLHVAGHLTRELHIPKTLAIVPRIVRRIAGERPSARGAGAPAILAAAALKRLRRKSALARRLVRDLPAIRRVVQAIDAADAMRDRRLSRLRRFVLRYPGLHRVVRSLRAYAS